MTGQLTDYNPFRQYTNKKFPFQRWLLSAKCISLACKLWHQLSRLQTIHSNYGRLHMATNTLQLLYSQKEPICPPPQIWAGLLTCFDHRRVWRNWCLCSFWSLRFMRPYGLCVCYLWMLPWNHSERKFV